MRFTPKLAGMVISATLAAAVPSAANATHFISFDGQNGAFGNTNVTTSPFSRTFNFTTATAGNLLADISNTGRGMTNIDFSSVTIDGVEFSILLGPATQTEFRTFDGFIGAGVHNLFVSGTSGGNASYVGNLSFGAVPEPATWAFMIFGFGAIGGAMRRQRKANVKVCYA